MQKQKILIFGASVRGVGWLAERYARHFNSQSNQFDVSISTADVTEAKEVLAAFDTTKPDIVVNAAGKTHGWGYPNIDGCESSKEARVTTYRVNVLGAENIAAACALYNSFLLHLGSGCIFDGYKDGGFTEADEPNPVSWYSKTKVSADRRLNKLSNILILRIRMPISAQVHPRNLITKLAGAKEIINVLNSVTVIEDLLEVSQKLIELRATGIYNVTNPTPVKHAEIVEWYCDIVNPFHRGQYKIIPFSEYKTLAPRSNCTLSTKKLEQLGIQMPSAPRSIQNYLHEYAEALHSVTA